MTRNSDMISQYDFTTSHEFIHDFMIMNSYATFHEICTLEAWTPITISDQYQQSLISKINERMISVSTSSTGGRPSQIPVVTDICSH